MRRENFDYMIIGAGIFGLYSALQLGKKNYKIAVLEHDSASFKRASFINQARVHNGYHYPRSLSTALKSASYFDKFNKDFDFAINSSFKKVYAIAKNFSFTDGIQFEKFCENAKIPCNEIKLNNILNYDTIAKTYETKEFSFDADKIRDYFITELKKHVNVTIFYNTHPVAVEKKQDKYELELNSEKGIFTSGFVINATYSGVNQIIDLFGFEKFKIKYEICEIITCEVSNSLKDMGITVMDGPFFSVMPFGLTKTHSLTAVEFTPHLDSQKELPVFTCQNKNPKCTPKKLENCNNCPARPKSAYCYMNQLAKKYLNEEVKIKYKDSYFAIKPILKMSELDDSRPTVIRQFSNNPTFISVLSGKINTIYDLDPILQ
ncbi:MAG: amino acid oxidase [Candidatus Moranbacteria bacterium GW2011_GWC1_45_18]|nr:MAG: D amino acid oxidase (DAO) family protein [Candidatus Moranbacteria bacterium GW2011_GWC2_40_12]KKU00157.1 MAG: amino acid oxidase [Candidatus Moranbacteria bacterium GW2011_GWC1_45_18]OGI23979.1 MAG: amino acid oxidase [Candidatus Moranbacteria bacterium RIFOXYA1_FULL_44_8]OGI35219.1 MAG: amino acid oxidase [Candidatus Moranbacteria bacterium RIFOXYC1_FULL_44_8]OGI39399.1 MAG: amino acid oxidase [Candidatus Moranbacteria bacterium RIFOXYB1_FULL_44_23]OGI41735.1 MAG: amino acid oxidase